jgi:hypothetical protein
MSPAPRYARQQTHKGETRMAASSQTEQIEIACSAKDAAWVAARAAEKANMSATAAPAEEGLDRTTGRAFR